MKKIVLISFVILFFSSCFLIRKTENSEEENVDYLNTVEVNQNKLFVDSTYRASDTKINDLIHTILNIKFDIDKKQVIATAQISLKPHFYNTDSLELDAKGFEINKIELVQKEKNIKLNYTYNNKKIKIKLDKTYTKLDEYTIFIDYTVIPSKITKKTKSWAINDDRGLYFTKSEDGSTQIWTQGETQSNSCWFPTIDSPNQKMTQEIFLTVDKNFKTLSNGILENTLLNTDETRTDYWKQDKPHAPYLTMIAAGNFSVITDSWRQLPLNYYVDNKKNDQAKKIFGKTPRMLEFYSHCFGMDFIWDKYSQIVVSDFVSGAMENTSATVFGDFVYSDSNEESQNKQTESTVAHELSHHWFGDLVTCESWANLTLNEAFGTYSEYLWFEHEFGKQEADLHLYEDFNYYMMESSYKNVDLIRYNYESPDDMFDMHSYQKGSLILHMLRNYVGDEAFFAALKYYLEQNKYKTVEVHNLRMAFEEITGRDLNQFFNQWFLNKGYPLFSLNYSYNHENNILKYNISQIQDLKNNPLFKVPLTIDIYLNDTIIRKKIFVEKQDQNFEFELNEKPLFCNFNADKVLLCNIIESKTKQEYLLQLEKAPLYRDKLEAFEGLKNEIYSQDTQLVIQKLLDNPFWIIRHDAIEYLNFKKDSKRFEKLKEKLKTISLKDENAVVRNAAKLKLEE